MKNKAFKRTISALVVFVLTLSLFNITSFAAGEEALIFALNSDETGYAVAGCDQTIAGEIVVPKEHNDLPVTEVSMAAFFGCTGITSVKLPDTITAIGDYAFFNCTNLSEINIPDSVTVTGNMAFYQTAYYNNKDNWKNGVLYIDNHIVYADTSVSGNLKIKDGTKTIIANAFKDCRNITSVEIPSSLKHISDAAFYGCSNLTSITISDGVETIGNKAFEGCKKVSLIVIPDSVLSIGNRAFHNCTSATDITLGNKVTEIGQSAFYGCNKVTYIYIPDSVVKIDTAAFAFCENLDYISFGKGLSTIGEQAFFGCKLSNLRIPNTVTEIENEAFAQCYIENLVIDKSVKKIGYNAFNYNKELSTVEFKGTPESVGSACFAECDNLDTVIFNTFAIKNLEDYITFNSIETVTSTSSGFVGTGNIVTVTPQGLQPYDFTCVVRNDVNGDGVADVLDAAYVALCINDLKEPDDIEKLAIDSNQDDEIDVMDYQQLINIILEA